MLKGSLAVGAALASQVISRKLLRHELTLREGGGRRRLYVASIHADLSGLLGG